MLENQRRYPQVQKVQYSFTGVLEKEQRRWRRETSMQFDKTIRKLET